jgi:hypothetical protein
MKGDQKNGWGFCFNKSVWAARNAAAGDFVTANYR